MSKVLVDPAALEEAAKWLEVHSSSSGSAEAFAAEALREAIARAAEAEGAVPVVCYLRAFQDGTPHWTEDCVCEDAVYPNHDGDETYSMPMVRQADHLAALSAVTAERDRLQAALDDPEYPPKYSRRLIEQLRAEVEALRAFGNEMVSAAFWGGSFDCGDIQDIAVKHGLLRVEQREAECGDACACSEYGFPSECYRKTELLGVAALAAKEAIQ
jgi:hypothetical protein